MTSATWSPLGHVASGDLGPARLTLHYAAQPLAAAAYALLPMREDHSHSNLLWSAERRGFVGRPLSSEQRLFLDPAALRIGLLAASGEESAVIELHGKTLAQAFTELAALLTGNGGDVPAAGLKLPEYDLPDSPLADAATFTVDAPALTELAHWYHDADQALSAVTTELLGDAELRVWPHHFDVAALLTLDQDKEPEFARSIGAGFSPGDGSYDEPYLYISPWPAPAPDALPPLPEGARWHTTGFTSAVVTGTALVEGGDADSQHARALALVEGCVDACLEVLG